MEIHQLHALPLLQSTGNESVKIRVLCLPLLPIMEALLNLSYQNCQQLIHCTVPSCVHVIKSSAFQGFLKFRKQKYVTGSHVWSGGRYYLRNIILLKTAIQAGLNGRMTAYCEFVTCQIPPSWLSMT